MPHPIDDPRRLLNPAPRADTGGRLPREPYVTEWARTPGRSQYVRGQNFTVSLTPLGPGEAVEESDVPDEHIVLLTQEGVRLSVSCPSGQAVLDEPGVVIVPPGGGTVTADRECTVLKVFSGLAGAVQERAANTALYDSPDPAVAPLPRHSPAARPTGPVVHRMSTVSEDPARLGRIFRTSNLMINWFPRQEGPRDPEKLSPHVHDDFEQGSVTLAGDFVHHFRTPWTPRLSEWREDAHVPCQSPSVAVIPPGVVHTTRAVHDGDHDLIDVFAPPRRDFLEQGWVLNAADYPVDPAPQGGAM
ncbi:hypothetical protein [Streptomyces sp. NPDC102360]|uniref:hypothetical protein n=1 Tax=Streptomyces sp. NPDC102360 TaxID=3366160 RepID=UPI0037F66608